MVFHHRKNKHSFVKTMSITSKWQNLCVYSTISFVLLDRLRKKKMFLIFQYISAWVLLCILIVVNLVLSHRFIWHFNTNYLKEWQNVTTWHQPESTCCKHSLEILKDINHEVCLTIVNFTFKIIAISSKGNWFNWLPLIFREGTFDTVQVPLGGRRRGPSR